MTTGGEPRETVRDRRPMLVLCRRCLNAEAVGRTTCSKCGWATEAVEWESEAAQTLSETLEGLAVELDARADTQLGTSLEPPPGDTTVAELESIGKRKAFREAASLLRDRANRRGDTDA